MSIYFDNCDIAVNGSGILASSASINSSNSIEAGYILGYNNIVNQLPQGPIRTNFSFSYSPVINYEPNFAITEKIKNILIVNDSGYLGEQIEIAGLSHDYCFLDSYSIRVQPNNLVESQASYITFWPLCGEIRERSNRINYLFDGSTAHAWVTQILSTGNEHNNNQNIYSLSYDFRANWEPIYVCGQKYPVQIKLLSASETLSFETDDYRNILFTGENIYNNVIIGEGNNIRFNNLSLICQDNCEITGYDAGTLSINVSGFRVKNIEVLAQLQQYLRVKYQGNKYY